MISSKPSLVKTHSDICVSDFSLGHGRKLHFGGGENRKLWRNTSFLVGEFRVVDEGRGHEGEDHEDTRLRRAEGMLERDTFG